MEFSHNGKPSLTEITLESLYMDGDDKCGLLESLRLIRNLTGLSIWGKQRGQARCYITESNAQVVDKGLNVEGAASNAALGRSLL